MIAVVALLNLVVDVLCYSYFFLKVANIRNYLIFTLYLSYAAADDAKLLSDVSQGEIFSKNRFRLIFLYESLPSITRCKTGLILSGCNKEYL